MTDETTTITTPMVQVVAESMNDVLFPLSEILLDGDDALTISDATIIERVARHLDMEVDKFSNMVVTRPRTGNILVSPKPTFG